MDPAGPESEWVTGADEDVRPSVHRTAELLDEHGFADARLAGDHRQPALAVADLVEQAVELLECSLSLQQLHSAALWLSV